MAAAALLLLAGAGPAFAVHFDVELRTSKGPVAGSRITTEFYGDLGLAGLLPIDALTGYKIFPGYFSDLEGGPFQTDDPGFQAFAGTFLRREEIHFRALGTLQYWNPDTGRWGPASAGVTLALFGGIPIEVIVGYTENPTAWKTQYDYYAAGTRFAVGGIDGPLTAVIDDASSSGAFHAHLDWKISATDGVPPAGAYLVTLSLWSPTLVGGQPKYQASEPIHLVFERGITEAQLAKAIAARVQPPAPARCEARMLTWQVGGSGCSADAPATESGLSALLQDSSAPTVGSASFSCQDGEWGSASAATCRPLLACGAQTLHWQSGGLGCSGLAAAAASGQTVLASDTTAPTLGSARFSCQDGAWSPATDAVCTPPPPRDCDAQVQAWQVGAAVCQAPLAAATAGSIALAADLTAPATGAARYRCDDGRWQLTELLSCALPRACARSTLSWEVGGRSCSAEAAAAESGTTTVLTDGMAPTLGSAGFVCMDGNWSPSGAAQCTVAPPRDCMAQPQTWTVAGESCQAMLPAGTAGSLTTIIDGTGPSLGNARYQCVDGSWTLAEPPACAVPSACSAENLGWQVEGQACSTMAPATPSGQTVLLNDATGPSLGSARFTCSSGRWSVPAQAQCSVPPPAACGAQVQTWQQGHAACQAALAATPAGGVLTAHDSIGPATGAARFLCQDGRWQLAEMLSCALPRACAGETLSWQVGSDTCQALAPATEDGQTAVISDTLAPALGRAEAQCSDGRFSLRAGATCATPPARCPAQTVTWVVGDAECSADTPSASAGDSVSLNDATGPSTGSALLQCVAGRWAAPTALRCERPPRDCAAGRLDWSEQGLACQADVPASASGQSLLAQDTGLPTLGTARFQCRDGQWSAPDQALCAVPDCAPQVLSWTQGGQICDGELPRTVSGAVARAQDDTLPTLGWARAQCLAGQWQPPVSAQCGAWQRDSARTLPRAPWQAPSRPPWAPP